MFIPPRNLIVKKEETNSEKSDVRVRSCHLQIDAKIAHQVFKEETRVALVYYAEKGQLMLASPKDEIFKSIHKTKSYMLKMRNKNSDCTVAIHDIFIDHNIDQSDRSLASQFNDQMGILTVLLS